MQALYLRSPSLWVWGSQLKLCQRHQRLHKQLTRNLFSQTGIWEKEFSDDSRKELERHWKETLQSAASNQNGSQSSEKYYALSMFPYPSGNLHMGHVRVYTISDAMARYQRLRGKSVLHPMGWDAFGLPAENAAIERGEVPDKWTYSNISRMKTQLEDLCLSFDWDREYATCDPAYYRWTQYLFLKLHEAGLVYRKEAPVNWDPVDHTVLADEQIDEEGRSWRSGAKAERRLLKQWYIRTTAYSKSLYDGLKDVNPELWRDVIALQKNWIGECTGMRIDFKLKHKGRPFDSSVNVFTHHPEAVYGASHILLSPEHPLNKPEYHLSTQRHQSVTLLDLQVVHPLTGEEMPVFVAHQRDFGLYLDAHLGIPSCSTEDLEFVNLRDIAYRKVLQTGEDEQITIVNSNQFSGLNLEEIRLALSKHLRELGCGGDLTSEKGRDWLISRQRYWGTPIPIVHCPKHGAVPVDYSDLPVKLPKLDVFTGKGTSPLENAEDWLKAKCARCDCDGHGRRETDTMDTFVDSSWYYLRYLDPRNTELPFHPDTAAKMMPVDLYIGGKEHAIMHLYYARFVMHFLHDVGMVSTREPFINLLTQGMVLGQSFRVKATGQYIRPDQVDFSGKKPVEKGSGAALVVEWQKMSKSKHNGVDPQAVLAEHGVDATRLCILSNVAPKSDRKWDPKDFVGIVRWQKRLWSLVHDFLEQKQNAVDPCPEDMQQIEESIFDSRNYFLKEVNFHMEKTFLLSVAISRLQGLTNALKKTPVKVLAHSKEFERALADAVIMISPFAPLFASELWTGLQSVSHHTEHVNWSESVLKQVWPVVDPEFRMSLKVKRNQKELLEVRLPMAIGQEGALTLEDALTMIENHPDFLQIADNVMRASLEVEPGYKAELMLTVKEEKKKKKKSRN